MPEDVKALARDLNVIDSRVFFVGQVVKKDVPAWLVRSIATILTCAGPEELYRDAVVNKFFDSMAARPPHTRQLSRLCNSGRRGVGAGEILPKDDLKAAASRCYELLNDGAWLAASGERALRIATEYFDRGRLTRDLEPVLTHAVAGIDPADTTPIGQAQGLVMATS